MSIMLGRLPIIPLGNCIDPFYQGIYWLGAISTEEYSYLMMLSIIFVGLNQINKPPKRETSNTEIIIFL